MIDIDIPKMMEAGAHFGHQTRRWNPKMKPYLYGARSGVHIIDLQKTKDLAILALQFIVDSVAHGKEVLFVGTKQQARDVVKEQAERCHMHYVNQRWMGGTLTNFKTIKNSIDRLIMLQTKRAKNDFEGYTKKEILDIDRTIEKLEASLGGIKKLTRYPDIVFIVDPNHEKIAVRESRKLGIPVVAVTDSNCDPDLIDYVIPSNDDAVAAVSYFIQKVAEASLLGLERREELVQKDLAEQEKSKMQGHKPARQKRVTGGTEKPANTGKGKKTAYVARGRGQEFEGEAPKEFSAKVEQSPPAEGEKKGDE